MLKLLRHTGTPGASDFVEDAFKAFSQEIKNLEDEGHRIPSVAKDLRSKITRNLVLRPRFKTLFQNAAYLGTSPLDILLRPKESASAFMFVDEIQTAVAPQKRKFVAKNYKRCEESFRTLMKLPSDVLLPPATQLCTKHGVSASNFLGSRRELRDMYTAERKRRSTCFTEMLINNAMSYSETLIGRARHHGIRIQQKKAVAQMQKDIGVSKRMARSALRVSLLHDRMHKDTKSS
jgi:hypothetical protein